MKPNAGNKQRLMACLLMLLQGMIYGLGDPLAKIAYSCVPVYMLLTVRYLLAAAVVFLLFGRQVAEDLRACSVRDWIAPCACVAVAYMLGNLALLYTNATSVAFLRSTSVIMTPLLAIVLFHRYPARTFLLPLCMSFAGLYLLCGRGSVSGFGLGELLALLTALFSAGALLFSKAALEKMRSVSLTAMQTVMSAILAIACMIFQGIPERLAAPPPKVWLIMVYLALFSTIGTYLLQNIALERIPARTVSLIKSFCPVMTAFFSYFILEETLSAAGIAGVALILGSIFLQTLWEGGAGAKRRAEAGRRM